MKSKVLQYVKRNRETFSGDSIEIKELPPGNYNFNYLVKVNDKKFVFKLYNPDLGGLFSNKGEEEYNALKLVEGLGIAPKAILFDNSKKFFKQDLLVYEYVEGKWIDFSNTSVKKMAEILVKLHSIDINNVKLAKKEEALEGLHKGILSNFKKLKEFKNVDRALLEEFEKLIKLVPIYIKNKKITPKFAFIHTDLVPSNIIESRKGIWLIDWQCPAIGDPVYDVWAFQSDAYNLWDKKKAMKEAHKKLFIKTYLDLKRDEDLMQRMKIKAPLYDLNLGLHCLKRLTQFRNKELPKEIQKREKQFERYENAIIRCLEDTKKVFENEGVIHS